MSTIRLLDVAGLFHPTWRVKESAGRPIGEAAAETVQVLRERAAAGGADYVVACCDSGRCFRHDIALEYRQTDPEYKGYKANRPPKDPAMMAALVRVEDELTQDGIAVLKAPGFEADDVIATIVAWATAQGHDVEVISDDKDLRQLVGPAMALTAPDGSQVQYGGVSVVKRDGEVIGPAEVKARFGVDPHQLGEYLAMVGDTSDHIKGIPGIGDKKAAAMLATYGTFAAIFEAAEKDAEYVAECECKLALAREQKVRPLPKFESPKFQNATRAAILASAGLFDISLRLTTLRTDVPVDFAQVTAPRVPNVRTSKTQWREPVPSAAEPTEPVFTIEEEEEQVANDTQQPITSEILPPLVTEVVNDAPPAATSGAVTATPTQIVVAPRAPVRLSPEQFRLALEPMTYDMARTVAEDMYDSGLFAVQRVQAALALIQVGRAHGLSAVTSLMEIHMIEGKPQMSAKLMVALVRKSGKADYFKLVESGPTGAKWKTHRKDDPDPDPVFGSFTIDEARRALLGGIATKGKDGIVIADDFKPDSQYGKYPEDMCVWRAAVRLIRREYSDVIGGLYATEEMDEYAPTTPYADAA